MENNKDYNKIMDSEDIDSTRTFKIKDSKDTEMKRILIAVYDALVEKG